MDHNVKIKNYKRSLRPSSYVQYSNTMAHPSTFLNNFVQQKMHERFQRLHWSTEGKLASLNTDDKIFVLRQEQIQITDLHKKEQNDAEGHRIAHLEQIKDNIKVTRETFYRRTQLERPGAIEEQLGPGPLYKIINDGKPILF